LRRRSTDTDEILHHIQLFRDESRDDDAEVRQIFGRPNAAVNTSEDIALDLLQQAMGPQIASFLMEVIWVKYKRPKNIAEYVDLIIKFLSACHHSRTEADFLALDSEIWNLSPIAVTPIGLCTEDSLAADLNEMTKFIVDGSISAGHVSGPDGQPNRRQIERLQDAQRNVMELVDLDIGSLPNEFPDENEPGPIGSPVISPFGSEPNLVPPGTLSQSPELPQSPAPQTPTSPSPTVSQSVPVVSSPSVVQRLSTTSSPSPAVVSPSAIS
jgi:hypothetical protein